MFCNFKVCEFGGDDCIKTPSVVDRTAHKHTQTLLDRVGSTYAYLKESCNLPDLPPAPKRPLPTKPPPAILKNNKTLALSPILSDNNFTKTKIDSKNRKISFEEAKKSFKF